MNPKMAKDKRPLAIALMGPTALGKSALALEWAQRLDGEIVSVDSALVYRGLDIGAAKPSAAERAAVPHHLIDVRDPWQTYSAAEFAIDARQAIDEIIGRRHVPILAGGTGLYFRALLHGLADMPAADAAVRRGIEAQAAARGWAALHDELAGIDPVAAARIHATDAQRIQRALEVFRISGRPISQWQRDAVRSRLPVRVLSLVLAPTARATLHARIESRFDAMLAQGFLDEVGALRALPIAFVGDGTSNMALSWIEAAMLFELDHVAAVAGGQDAVECCIVHDAFNKLTPAFFGLEGFSFRDDAVVAIKFLPGDFV